jgi:hypothetical protein
MILLIKIQKLKISELIDNELHWKSSGEKVDKVIKIDDPASLRYVGYGLFQDSKKAYSIGYITQHHDGEKSVSLDGNQLLTALGTVSSSSYLINGTRVFALVSEMSLPWLELVERADAKTFEALNSNYAKDNNSVYYFADKLSNADPANFSIKTLGFFRFGVSGEKIYWKGHLLEGLNGSKLSAELGGSVLTDGSTYYYQTGGCHLVNFSKGTAEELLKYKPPC